jgi:hypothetical protein
MPFGSDPVTAASPPSWRPALRTRSRPVSGSDYFTKEKSMSFVTTQPQALFSAVGNLQGINAYVSTLSAGGESYPTTEAANAVAAG